MYALSRLLPLRYLLMEQIPALMLSIMIAEFFYKFHSFTLECIAFLATWYLVDLVIQAVRGRFEPAEPSEQRRRL